MNGSRIEKTTHHDVHVLTLTGEFGAFETPRVAERLDAAVRAGARAVVVNLRNVEFVNLSTIGSLVRTQRRLRERDGELVVSEPSRFCRRTVDLLGLEEVIRVFSADDEAVRYLRAVSAAGAPNPPETSEGSEPAPFGGAAGADPRGAGPD